jgi:hypothetical protein
MTSLADYYYYYYYLLPQYTPMPAEKWTEKNVKTKACSDLLNKSFTTVDHSIAAFAFLYI